MGLTSSELFVSLKDLEPKMRRLSDELSDHHLRYVKLKQPIVVAQCSIFRMLEMECLLQQKINECENLRQLIIAVPAVVPGLWQVAECPLE